MYMHFLLPCSSVEAPLMAADSLLAHMEAEQGKNRSMLGFLYPCRDVICSAAVPENDEQWALQKHYF